MANSISLHETYLDALDEVYKQVSLTADLDTEAIASKVQTGKKFKVDKIEMDGLSDYSRSSGYTAGDVTVTQEEVEPNYDRGKKFSVDTMDDLETGYKAFGRLGGEFERTKVVPEIDAFRFAKYATLAGGSAVGTLSSSTVISAIDTAEAYLTDAEVPDTDRYIKMSAEVYNYLKAAVPARFVNQVDTSINRNIETFDLMPVKIIPQGRFYTGCTLGSNGFTNAGVAINFMIIHKPALIQFAKHIASNVIDPANNPDADAYIMKYRNYGLADVYENKVDGIYVHAKAQDVTLTVTTSPSDATVVIKKDSASGDAITGSAGVYTIPSGTSTYYYSVSKTGYVTQTGTVTLTGREIITGSVELSITLVAAE